MILQYFLEDFPLAIIQTIKTIFTKLVFFILMIIVPKRSKN